LGHRLKATHETGEAQLSRLGPSLTVAFSVSLAAPAAAADYSIDYAVGRDLITETGTLDNCTFNRPCKKLIKDWNAWLRISVRRGYRVAEVSLGGEPGCCIFADAQQSASINTWQTFHRLAVFWGRARRGNELVLNQPVGTLLLWFRNNAEK
jgi:hypothetical protein